MSILSEKGLVLNYEYGNKRESIPMQSDYIEDSQFIKSN